MAKKKTGCPDGESLFFVWENFIDFCKRSRNKPFAGRLSVEFVLFFVPISARGVVCVSGKEDRFSLQLRFGRTSGCSCGLVCVLFSPPISVSGIFPRCGQEKRLPFLSREAFADFSEKTHRGFPERKPLLFSETRRRTDSAARSRVRSAQCCRRRRH